MWKGLHIYFILASSFVPLGADYVLVYLLGQSSFLFFQLLALMIYSAIATQATVNKENVCANNTTAQDYIWLMGFVFRRLRRECICIHAEVEVYTQALLFPPGSVPGLSASAHTPQRHPGGLMRRSARSAGAFTVRLRQLQAVTQLYSVY